MGKLELTPKFKKVFFDLEIESNDKYQPEEGWEIYAFDIIKEHGYPSIIEFTLREKLNVTNSKNKKDKLRTKKIKNNIRELFNSKCCNCKSDKNLEFHHVENKDFVIFKNRISSNNWETIKEELSKCILVCRKCHNDIHNSKLNDKQFIMRNLKYIKWEQINVN